jgi:hypothetical protein
MPSILPIPTLRQYVAAFHRGVKARREERADGHSGSAYDYIAGTTAMLMARESAFIRDLFRADYFDLAEGQDLSNLIAGRFQIPRILDTYGVGTTALKRPTNAAGAGTIWKGTRILIQAPTPTGLVYQVAADTPVSAAALNVAPVGITATTLGVGTAINTTQSGNPAAILDPLWDTSWQVVQVQCANGTVFEKAKDYRARTLALLAANQVGYSPGIAAACNAVGAVNVSVFGTNFGGQDLHACATYVGDAGFNGSPNLVALSTVALEAWRMLGPDMLIGAMVQTPLPIAATIQVYADPSTFDIPTLSFACIAALTQTFGVTGSYGYDLDALFGSVVGLSTAIQDCDFTTPTSNQTLLVGNPLWFPQSLPRYQIPPNGIQLTFVGPS